MFQQYGEIHNICFVGNQNCAFIQYKTRAAAELAAESMYDRSMLNGQKLIIRWGHSNVGKTNDGTSLAAIKETKTKVTPEVLTPLPMESQNSLFNISPQTVAVMAPQYIPVVAPHYVPVVAPNYIPVVAHHYVPVVTSPFIPVVAPPCIPFMEKLPQPNILFMSTPFYPLDTNK